MVKKFIKNNNWYIHFIKNDKDYIKQIFFTKVFSQKILKYNYKVLLINTIYKTNKYKMYLIIISKITLLNISYYIAFAFIFKEIYKVYKWLLKSIQNFYKYFNIPNLNIILIDIQNSFI